MEIVLQMAPQDGAFELADPLAAKPEVGGPKVWQTYTPWLSQLKFVT